MTLLMAFLTGLATPPALVTGVWLGLRWWRALRRSEGHTDPETKSLRVYPEVPTLPPPPSQDDRVVRLVRWGAQPRRSHRRR